MAETLIFVLVSILGFICLCLLGVLIWREVEHRKQVDVLTSKLMSRDYREYAVSKKTEKGKREEKEEKPKANVDSVLGSHY